MILDSWAVFAVVAKLFGVCGTLVAAGSGLFLVVFRPAGPVVTATRKAGWLGVGVGLGGTALFFFAQIGALSDAGFRGMFDSFLAGLLLNGRLGDASFFRVAGLLLVALGLLYGPALRILLPLGALLVAASFALHGHATGDPRAALSVLIMIHMLAVIFWIGALYPLYRATKQMPVVEAANLAHRFGKLALWVVPVLMVAGGLFVALRVSPLSALLTTSYGWTLGAKLLVVLSLLGLANMNRARFVPAMLAGDARAARSLRRVIGWEAAAFLAIIALTTLLTTLTPIPSGH